MTRRLLPVLFLLAPLAGCGGPLAHTVGGTVAFAAKKPAGNLLLQFVPAGGGVGGSAVTDDAGKFQVKGDDGRDGLPAGTYTVVVIDNNLSTDDEPDKQKGKAPPINRVAVKYQSVGGGNPLQVTVPGGPYDLKLD